MRLKLLRFILLVSTLVFCVRSTAAQTPVPVTGNVTNILGSPTSTNTFVRIRLRNFSGYVPRVVGVGAINVGSVDVTPNSAGLVTSSAWGNDAIQPGPNITYYTFEFWANGKMFVSEDFQIDCVIVGGSCTPFNFNTASPLSTPPINPLQFPVLLDPLGLSNQNIIQPPGTFLQVNGNNVSLISGSVTIGDCVKFGPPPFLLDAGAPCGTSGGGGGSPGGSDTQIQFNKGGAFGALTGFQLDSSTSPTTLFNPLNLVSGGPNPSIDFTSLIYGGRAVTSIPQTTATMSGVSSTATLAAASTFQNGDWVVIRGAGAAPPGTVTTPSAPTVNPVVAAGAIGANRNAALAGGGTTYSYEIRLIDLHEGYTAASSVTTITNGASSLGATGNAVTITSVTRTNNQLAIVMSAPFNTAVNGIVFIAGTSDATMNNIFCRVNTWTDNEHFTCQQGMDTRAGATTAAASGGTAQSYAANLLTLPALPAGGYQYAIYGRTGSAPYPFISFVTPGVSTFTDYGSPFMDNQFIPDWLPATTAGGAGNDDCSTEILSGAGTTTLNFASSCVNAVSNATIKFDDGPALVAAGSASITSGTSGTLNIPAANGFYPINSHIVLPCGYITQNGELDLYSTIDIAGGGCVWTGIGGSSHSAPQFAWSAAPLIAVRSAYPGLNMNGGSTKFDHLAFSSGTAGEIIVFNGTNTFNDTIVNSSFVVNGLNSSVPDYVGLAILGAGSSQQIYSQDLFSLAAPSSPAMGSTLAPFVLYVAKGPNASGNLFCDACYSNYRGFAFDDTLHIGNVVHFHGSYIQAGIAPYVSFAGTNTLVTFDGFTSDTSSQAIVANWNAALNLKIWNSPTLATNGVTGDPFGNIQYDANGTFPLPGQNTGIFKVGTAAVRNPIFNPYTGSSQGLYTSSDFVMRGPLHFPTGELFFDLKTTAPVSAAASTGGTILTAGNWTFEMTATDQLSGESSPSSPSNTCTTSGSNLICVLTGTPVQGAAVYSFYASNGGGYASLSACRNITTPNCNAGASGALDGSTMAPSGNSAAITRVDAGQISAPSFVLIGGLSSNISFTDILTGTFSANRTLSIPDVSGVLGVVTGTITNGHCAQFTVTGGVISVIDSGAGCGGGGGGCTITVNEVAVGTGTNTCGGFADFTFTDGPPTLSLLGTSGGSTTLGGSSATAASGLFVWGGSGPSNTTPGWIGAEGSPSSAFSSYLFPCTSAGNWCISSTVPAADSAHVIQTVIASGTAVMTTAAISAGNCGTTVTVSAPGVLTTDSIQWSFSAAPAGTNAGITPWPTANNVNFAYCPGVAETPAAATINWRVTH